MTNRFLTTADRMEICSWRYEGEYAVYNLPSYEEMRQTKSGFMNPDKEKDYRGFFADSILIGYVHIWEKPDGVFIGIGVRPDQCGKHYGTQILKEACKIAGARFPAKTLCLEVRIWNIRAIRCYQNAGFQFDGAPYEKTTPLGKGSFVKMIKT